MKGVIQRQGEVLVDNVLFEIVEVPRTAHQRGGWFGTFQVPAGGCDEVWEVLNSHDPVWIELEDGRTGEIQCARSVIAESVPIPFIGVDVLESPAHVLSCILRGEDPADSSLALS